jgi:hypothetical protein
MARGSQRQIRGILKGLGTVTEKVIKKVTLDLTANLIESTPVDVGFARANWVPKIGSPYEANLSGVNATSQSTANARNVQSAATAAITGYKLPAGSVFVSNNVSYITALNDGSSKQEPKGFVQRAIRKAVTVDLGRV